MQFVQVLCSFCAATNGLITPFVGQLQRKHSIFIKRYFKIVYIKRVRKVLCLRCFRCSCTLIGLYLPCTACAPHRASSSFFLNKGKGIGSPICRAAPRGCRRPCTPSTNTARAQGRGIKGGEAPFAGGPGTRRFLAYLCLLSLREKVGRGAGRSARIGGCRDYQSRTPPSGEAERKKGSAGASAPASKKPLAFCRKI